MKNGREKGEANVELFEQFALSGVRLPVSSSDGTLNVTELAKLTGILKSAFYQNPTLANRLEQLRLEQGISRREVSEKKTDPVEPERVALAQDKNTAFLERKIQVLEQQNAVLAAENYELRKQSKFHRLQQGRVDMVIDTGRRVAIPPEST